MICQILGLSSVLLPLTVPAWKVEAAATVLTVELVAPFDSGALLSETCREFTERGVANAALAAARASIYFFFSAS